MQFIKIFNSYFCLKKFIYQIDLMKLNFLFKKRWVDKDDVQVDDEIEKEDEEREDEMDNFELRYNFRFEEKGADQVQSKL